MSEEQQQQQPAAQAQAEGACSIKEYTFQEEIHDIHVSVQILMMNRSCMVWVGTGASIFQNLDVAMQTHMETDPISSTLMGSAQENQGGSLAKRLSLRFGYQVFVSYNLPATEMLLKVAMEKRIFAEFEKIMTAKE